MALRVFSYGGGVQSTAALVLAAEGRIDFPRFLFCNVGDDSENPATLAYVEEHARPYAARMGIGFEELRRTTKTGRPETLLGVLERDTTYNWIPMRPPGGKAPTRACSTNFKVYVVAKRLTALGATPADPAVVGLGISLDEIQRMRTPFDPRLPSQVKQYPLVELRLDRRACAAIIARAGLPVPPKSACWFCPFKPAREWEALARADPATFDAAARLDARLRERSVAAGKGPTYIHHRYLPLYEAVATPTRPYDDGEDSCESGYCMV